MSIKVTEQIQRPPRNWLRRSRKAETVAWVWLAVVLACALVGPMVVPSSALRQDLLARHLEPGLLSGTFDHALGTDALGRDLLARIVVATRTSIVIGVASLAGAAIIGSLMGLIAGYARGWVDAAIMRGVDVTASFPGLLLAVVVLYVLGGGEFAIVIVLAVSRWPVFARLVRAETLRLRDLDYVVAYKSLGYRSWSVLRHGFVPNMIGVFVALAALNLGQLILAESSLSFLGLGVQAPDDSWGLIVAQGRAYVRTAWWVVAFSGSAIFATALAIGIVAESVAEAADPLRRREGRRSW